MQEQKPKHKNPVIPIPKKAKEKASGFKRFMQILLIVILLAVVGVMAYAGYLYYQVQGMFDGVGPKDNGGTVISQPVAPEKSAKVKPITMALLGTDYRQETGTRLTDVVMVATLNPDTKSATIVSLPRDTYLQLEGYIPNKLNSYYPKFYAKDKKEGTDLAMSEMKTLLGKYLGVDVEYTTVLNFQGFRDVVDSVGGIDINVDMKMCYVDKADGTNINLSTGQQHLNGANSLDYVRYRKSNCSPRTQGSDDFSRNQRQNQVLNAVVDKIQSFSGVTKLGSIIESVDKNMETDIEGEQFKNLLTTYWDIPKQNIKYMPVTGDWKSPYVYINETELANAKQALQDELAGTATHTDQFDQPAGTSKVSQ
ncbi:Transcriptional regulator LytR [Paenibacillus nuruki]|nr:Transcriptional regulator LytR [Paenibacillus nuruki]